MVGLRVEKFKASAIRDTVADALRRALLEGCFKPGESLSDAAIAVEFHISRGPVREAMLVLAGEGLLVHTQNRGFFVLNFTEADLSKIDEVRLPLESLALANARAHATEADFKYLNKVKTKLARAFESDDQFGRLRAEFEFHGYIWELAGNPWLVSSLKRIMFPSFTYGTAFRLNRPGLSGEMMAQMHNLYIEFLAGTSPYTAEECVRLHIGLPSNSAT
jgi:DNA-binding GntR family transcriptional regulator